MTFVDYMRALRRTWWLVFLLAIAGAAALAVPTTSEPETFRASVRFVVSPADDLDAASMDEAVRNLTTNGAVLKTFALILQSDEVRARATADAGIPEGEAATYEVTAFALSDTAAAQVEVRGPVGDSVGSLASAIGDRGATQFETLFTTFHAEPLDLTGPSAQSPRTVVYGVVGGVAGFALGFLLAVARFSIAEAGGLREGRRSRSRRDRSRWRTSEPVEDRLSTATARPMARHRTAWQAAIERTDPADREPQDASRGWLFDEGAADSGVGASARR